MPRDDAQMDQAAPIERMSMSQSMMQVALLGVPYSVLADACNPKNGAITSVDLQKLKAYYEGAIQNAKEQGDFELQTRLGTQLAAVSSMLNQPSAATQLNASLAQLNVTSEQLRDPNNQQTTLNELLAQKNENYHALQNYLQQKNLTINPAKEQELQVKILGATDAMKTSDFDAIGREFFLSTDPQHQELIKLNLAPERAKEFFAAFQKLTEDPRWSDVRWEATASQKLKITSNGKELLIDPIKMTLEGLNNSAGVGIQFESPEDLVRTALLINKIRGSNELRGEQPDVRRQSDENWPFDLSQDRYDVLFKNIVFKHHQGERSVLTDRMPFFSQMDRSYSTIEARQNRVFFVKYLNSLWKQDHPN